MSYLAVILATTSAAVSNPFRVNGDKPVAVRAFGLAGAETVVIQIDRGDGQFQDILDSSGTLTATAYQAKITCEGLYRLSKTATVGAAGAAAG